MLAGVASLAHVAFFLMESVLFSRPAVWRGFGVTSQPDADVMRPMAFNQGFYNLFLAAGAAGGVVAVATTHRVAGEAWLVLACGSMVLAALVLVATDRRFIGASLLQGVPPAAALAALAVAH